MTSSSATTWAGIAGDAHAFFGIRYAEASRFEPATVVAPPDRVVATTPGPAPWQLPVRGLGLRGTANVMAEDCLNLNVFTPSCDSRRRAVMVWIFGGGFVNGDGADPMFDGRLLAAHGDVVIVTINYRLGVFGFFADAPANLGLRDQIAALEWVRNHIADFGGDPGNVTLFGESAGAMSICTLLNVPAARGLFHRAIAQSGAGENVARLDQAHRVAALFREYRSGESPAALLDAQQHTSTTFYETERRSAFRPWIDGTVLPDHPESDPRRGADVPLIIGWNRDEQRSYINPRERISAAELGRRLERRFPGDAGRIMDFFAGRFAPEFEHAAILAAAYTELRFRRLARRYAEARGENTWCYRFNWASKGLRGWLGACHAIEIPFIFGNLTDRTTQKFVGPGAGQLSTEMQKLWTDFARNGRPSDDWPPFPATLDIHPDFAVRDHHADDAFWDSL